MLAEPSDRAGKSSVGEGVPTLDRTHWIGNSVKKAPVRLDSLRPFATRLRDHQILEEESPTDDYHGP